MTHGRMLSASGLGFAVAAVLLGACGGGDEASGPATPATATTTETPAPSTTPKATPAPVTQVVGASGGKVVNADGSGIDVPPGALPSDVTLVVTATPAATPPATGDVVGTPTTFGPSGLKFEKPVTVLLSFDAAKLPAGASAASIVVFTAPDGTTDFTPLPTEPFDATHVAAQTTHFSILVPMIPPAGTCEPTACASTACGTAPNGCGGTTNCGPCPLDASPDGCQPATCASYGASACGSLSNGCGGTLDCGACVADAGVPDDATAAPDATGAPDATAADDASDATVDDATVDADACHPISCTLFGGTICGDLSDNCGGTISCACNSGKVCHQNQCCTPKTCGTIPPPDAGGVVCGVQSDGCGGTLNCGACPYEGP